MKNLLTKVAVVHCKDCKHKTGYNVCVAHIDTRELDVEDNDYCSWGELDD